MSARTAWRVAVVSWLALAAATGGAMLPFAGPAPSARAATRATAPAEGTAQVTSSARESGTVRESGSGGGYRYWSFWKQKNKPGERPHDEPGEWSYATQGPSVLRPDDGDVIGFRFAVSEDSKDAPRPRDRTKFSVVCNATATKPMPGRKRIAIRVDFGLPPDAPRGEHPPEQRTECARVPDDATAADALAAVAEPLRYDSAGVLCAIDGYPERGCAEQVAADEKNGAKGGAGEGARDGNGDGAGSFGGLGPVAGVVAGVGAVAVLAFAAFRRSRRRQ